MPGLLPGLGAAMERAHARRPVPEPRDCTAGPKPCRIVPSGAILYTLHCTLTMGEAVLCCATVCTLLCSAMLSGVVSRCVFTELYCTVLRQTLLCTVLNLVLAWAYST